MIDLGLALYTFETAKVCIFGGLFFGLVNENSAAGAKPVSAKVKKTCNANKVRVEKNAVTEKPASFAEAKDFLDWLYEHDETGQIAWTRLCCLYAEYCEVVEKAPRPDNVWPKHLTNLGVTRELKRISAKGEPLKRAKFYFIKKPVKMPQMHHSSARFVPGETRVRPNKTRVQTRIAPSRGIRTPAGRGYANSDRITA